MKKLARMELQLRRINFLTLAFMYVKSDLMEGLKTAELCIVLWADAKAQKCKESHVTKIERNGRI